MKREWHATGLRFGVGSDLHPPTFSVLDEEINDAVY